MEKSSGYSEVINGGGRVVLCIENCIVGFMGEREDTGICTVFVFT